MIAAVSRPYASVRHGKGLTLRRVTMTEDNAATGDTLRWTHRINLCFRSPIVTPISSNGAINTTLRR
jgi:hypothetical protein